MIFKIFASCGLDGGTVTFRPVLELHLPVFRHRANNWSHGCHASSESSLAPFESIAETFSSSKPIASPPASYRQIQKQQPTDAEHLLPRVHRVISLLKRWLMGTHQGGIAHEHLEDYLNEFTFRFNRRTSASRGKLFYRLAQQSVLVSPVPFNTIAQHKR